MAPVAFQAAARQSVTITAQPAKTLPRRPKISALWRRGDIVRSAPMAKVTKFQCAMQQTAGGATAFSC